MDELTATEQIVQDCLKIGITPAKVEFAHTTGCNADLAEEYAVSLDTLATLRGRWGIKRSHDPERNK